jgi:hypothetical protein
VNVERMLTIFRQGALDLAEVWESALAPESRQQVIALARAGSAPFHFPDPLWVRVVYDMALAYHRRTLPGDQLLRSLVPLYLGRTASFVLQNADRGVDEVEDAIRALADEFVRAKGYLVAGWDGVRSA